ncbi:MAG TPA: hypothetical protein VIF57_31745 [Polyangia bacterium]
MSRDDGTLLLAISFFALTALSFSGACKRASTQSSAPTTSAEVADVPSGCWETNPSAEKAGACMACLKKNKIESPMADGCCGIHDSTGLQLCQAVSACIRAGGPPVGNCNLAGDTTTCYCGRHQADCDIEGKANGPCVPQIAAAAGRNIETRTTDTPTPGQIMERYGLTKYALGRATNIAAIAGALCKTECGTGM